MERRPRRNAQRDRKWIFGALVIFMMFAGVIFISPFFSTGFGKAATDAPPNIIVIVADQMRWDAQGLVNRQVKTPNLNQLAREGMYFRNAVATSPVCSAMRVTAMAGRYPHNGGDKLIVGEPAFPSIAKAMGYATNYIGKWHLTPEEVKENDPYASLGRVPDVMITDWDHFAGTEESHVYYDGYYWEKSGGVYPTQPKMHWGYVPDGETKIAIQRIAVSQEPFLLFLSYGPPHHPYIPPAGFNNLYDAEDILVRPNVPEALVPSAQSMLANYYGLVSSIDYNVGLILDELDKLGIADNTIVAFFSDHGDMMHSQGVSKQDKKRLPYEESIRTPFIIRYPAKVAPEGQSDVVIGSIDYLPTLLDLADIPVPAGMPGKSYAPLLTGNKDRDRGTGSAYLELGEDPTNPFGAPWRTVVTDDGWKYAVAGDALSSSDRGILLYNLREDPYEMTNLVGDSTYAAQEVKLRDLMLKWAEETGDDFFRQ